MILNISNDIGFLHVLDYYLYRAVNELAAHGARYPYSHYCPHRYRDVDADDYS